jgi:predicted phage terminase large subunit-like protein
VTALVRGREVWVLDVFRQRLKFPELKRHATRLAREWKASDLLIEDQASGTQLIDVFRSEQPVGVPAPIARVPEGDKVSRLMGVSGQVEAGQLLLPEEAHWLPDFKAELLGFPNTRYDDQCDALSQLMSWIQRREALAGQTLAGPVGFTLREDGSTEVSGDHEGLFGGPAETFNLDDDPWL